MLSCNHRSYPSSPPFRCGGQGAELLAQEMQRGDTQRPQQRHAGLGPGSSMQPDVVQITARDHWLMHAFHRSRPRQGAARRASGAARATSLWPRGSDPQRCCQGAIAVAAYSEFRSNAYTFLLVCSTLRRLTTAHPPAASAETSCISLLSLPHWMRIISGLTVLTCLYTTCHSLFLCIDTCAWFYFF